MVHTFDLNACHCSTIVCWLFGQQGVEHCSFGDDASGLRPNNSVVDYMGSCVDAVAFDDEVDDLQTVVAVACDDKCFVEDLVKEAVVCSNLA